MYAEQSCQSTLHPRDYVWPDLCPQFGKCSKKSASASNQSQAEDLGIRHCTTTEEPPSQHFPTASTLPLQAAVLTAGKAPQVHSGFAVTANDLSACTVDSPETFSTIGTGIGYLGNARDTLSRLRASAAARHIQACLHVDQTWSVPACMQHHWRDAE